MKLRFTILFIWFCPLTSDTAKQNNIVNTILLYFFSVFKGVFQIVNNFSKRIDSFLNFHSIQRFFIIFLWLFKTTFIIIIFFVNSVNFRGYYAIKIVTFTNIPPPSRCEISNTMCIKTKLTPINTDVSSVF